MLFVCATMDTAILCVAALASQLLFLYNVPLFAKPCLLMASILQCYAIPVGLGAVEFSCPILPVLCCAEVKLEYLQLL